MDQAEEPMDTSGNMFDDILMDTCEGAELCQCGNTQDIQGLCRFCWVKMHPKGLKKKKRVKWYDGVNVTFIS